MRVLIQQGSGVAGQRVALDEGEAHHLRVRRAKERDVVEVLDGMGFLGSGELVQAGKQWMVDIQSAEQQKPPPQTVLAVAAGDRERFGWIVEKSVELAVTRIIPLETKRTSGVATRLKENHLARLRRSGLEAIKQCGGTWAPTIENPQELATLMKESRAGSRWLADQTGSPAPTSVNDSPVTVIVGPEGGLTDDEREAVVGAGYQPVSLSVHTLRFETAALAAAAVLAQARLRGAHG